MFDCVPNNSHEMPCFFVLFFIGKMNTQCLQFLITIKRLLGAVVDAGRRTVTSMSLPLNDVNINNPRFRVCEVEQWYIWKHRRIRSVYAALRDIAFTFFTKTEVKIPRKCHNREAQLSRGTKQKEVWNK